MSHVNDFTLDQWLCFLENRYANDIRLGLTRIKTVANRLDLLNVNAPVITVAGTNGKGSTISALEAIYCAAGYRVGTYTSPHLLTFNERIRVNQHPVSDATLCAAFNTLEQVRGVTPLTYFEMVTLAALMYFKQSALDIILLEVGMGGRLDATNIIDADVAIITTIDFDHQVYLGDTLDAIGYEKAGIMRANKPCIYADEKPPKRVIEYAASLNVSLQCLGTDYSFFMTDNELHIKRKDGTIVRLPLPRINHKAAVAAVMASDVLHAVRPVTQAHLEDAMRQVFIAGRQHVVKNNAVISLFDVGHNPQAVALLADCVKHYSITGRVHAVFSGLKDKDLCGLIRAMHSCVTDWYPARLTGKRSASESELSAAFLTETGTRPVCFSDPVVAYRTAMQRAKPGDLIVVYGSFLTVSAVMAANKMEQEELQ